MKPRRPCLQSCRVRKHASRNRGASRRIQLARLVQCMQSTRWCVRFGFVNSNLDPSFGAVNCEEIGRKICEKKREKRQLLKHEPETSASIKPDHVRHFRK